MAVERAATALAKNDGLGLQCSACLRPRQGGGPVQPGRHLVPAGVVARPQFWHWFWLGARLAVVLAGPAVAGVGLQRSACLRSRRGGGLAQPGRYLVPAGAVARQWFWLGAHLAGPMDSLQNQKWEAPEAVVRESYVLILELLLSLLLQVIQLVLPSCLPQNDDLHLLGLNRYLVRL